MKRIVACLLLLGAALFWGWLVSEVSWKALATHRAFLETRVVFGVLTGVAILVAGVVYGVRRKRFFDSIPFVLVLCLSGLPFLGATELFRRSVNNHGHPAHHLRKLSSAQTEFREADKDGNDVLDYGSLAALSQQGMIDHVLGAGTYAGYVYELYVPAETSEFLWMAVANPQEIDLESSVYREALAYGANQEGQFVGLAPLEISPSCATPAGAVGYPHQHDKIDAELAKRPLWKNRYWKYQAPFPFFCFLPLAAAWLAFMACWTLALGPFNGAGPEPGKHAERGMDK